VFVTTYGTKENGKFVFLHRSGCVELQSDKHFEEKGLDGLGFH
jgi:hypothetical protein